jgi:hypothetical protein
MEYHIHVPPPPGMPDESIEVNLRYAKVTSGSKACLEKFFACVLHSANDNKNVVSIATQTNVIPGDQDTRNVMNTLKRIIPPYIPLG